MYGTWRYLLALCVAATHLCIFMVNGSASCAVWAFYTLSGFLMCTVLNEKYGFSLKGLGRFARARFFKIYPGLWLTAAILVLLMALTPSVVSHFGEHIAVPATWKDAAYSILLIRRWGGTAIVPGTVTLANEVFFYVVIAFVGARDWRLCAIWFGLSALYTLGNMDLSFPVRYTALETVTLPFSFGCLLGHMRSLQPGKPWLPLVAWFVYALTAHHYRWEEIGLYVSMLISGWTILSLYHYRSEKWAKIDSYLGELSYPIYLMHWLAGMALYGITGMDRGNPWFFLFCFPLIHGLAHLTTVHILSRKPKPARKEIPFVDPVPA